MGFLSDRVLVPGADGQLGRMLLKTQLDWVEVIGLGHDACNIEQPRAIAAAFERYQPRAIINAAAFANVDKAEVETARAFAVNADGLKNLAQAARDFGARFVHVSTDYVFDGAQQTPYATDARPNPLNRYGASKLAGEKAFLASGVDGAIVRTSWVFSADRRGFVSTLLKRIRQGKPLQFVCDQTGAPTAAQGLARVLLRIACDDKIGGIWHWTNSGSCSRYDQAVATQEFAIERHLIKSPVQIDPISAAEYGAPAVRPSYSVLDASALWERYDSPPDWRSELKNTVAAIESNDLD